MKLSLDLLRIEEPCPRAWDSMRGDHRSRYCGHCHKTVFNAAAWSGAEIRALLERDSSPCMRLTAEPDGTLITRDTPRRRRAWFAVRRWLAWAAALLMLPSLTGCILTGSVAPTQGAPRRRDTAELGGRVVARPLTGSVMTPSPSTEPAPGITYGSSAPD